MVPKGSAVSRITMCSCQKRHELCPDRDVFEPEKPRALSIAFPVSFQPF